MSLIWRDLRLSMIKGRASTQSASFAARMAVFKVRWNLSTKPLACGWYAVVLMLCTPNRLSACCQRLLVNCRPRSVVTCAGTPKLAIQWVRKARAHVSARMSWRGTATGHLVKRSMAVRR